MLSIEWWRHQQQFLFFHPKSQICWSHSNVKDLGWKWAFDTGLAGCRSYAMLCQCTSVGVSVRDIRAFKSTVFMFMGPAVSTSQHYSTSHTRSRTHTLTHPNTYASTHTQTPICTLSHTHALFFLFLSLPLTLYLTFHNFNKVCHGQIEEEGERSILMKVATLAMKPT